MKFAAVLFPLISLVVACSPTDNPPPITFTPQVGDTANYWVQIKTNFDVDGNQAQLSAINLLNYVVEKSSSKTLEFSVVPRYMDLDGKGIYFSSIRPATRRLPMRDVVVEGFELTVDASRKDPVTLTSKDAQGWQNIAAKGGQQFLAMMTQSINIPGFIETIPAQVGANIPLAQIGEHSVEMVVDRVTPTLVILTITGHNQQSKLFGKVSINRNQGWIEQLVLISEAPMEVGRSMATAHTLHRLVKANTLGNVPFINPNSRIPTRIDWADLPRVPTDMDQLISPTKEQVFKFNQGQFFEGENKLFTSLLLTDDDVQLDGKLVFTDINASSSQIPTLDITLAPTRDSWTQPEMDGLVTEQQLVPLGFLNQGDIDEIDHITATANYYPSKTNSLTLEWQTNQTMQHQQGDTNLTITPVAGTENEYLVSYRGNSTDFLLPYVGNVEGQFAYVPTDIGPDWLTTLDKYLLSLYQTTLRLKVTNSPKNVTVYIQSTAPESTFSHPVEWVKY
ncbi:hypothetical protein [Shewanella sp. NIFS-20-20]|uniref:hypothetical protein n=1 Tax=Shewanella sp. NIFS-20-20 TaxID=2853806 RepID=UPI001C46771A|nr:hypothetical protein [Shewanella sp. NIFS-20-20]MBV7314458.1 hypothetical protein [Shewanella sp. NIFS-20-20]